MRHINKMRKYAERLDNIHTHTLKLSVCILSKVLGGFRGGVCGGEAGGHRRLCQVVWIKERELNQTLVHFTDDSFSCQALL